MEEHRISVSDNEPTNKCWLCHRCRQDFFLLWTVFWLQESYLFLFQGSHSHAQGTCVTGLGFCPWCMCSRSQLSINPDVIAQRILGWPRGVLPEWEEPRAAWVPDCGSCKTPELTWPGLWTIIRLLPSLDPFPAGSGGLCTVLETYKPSSPMPSGKHYGVLWKAGENLDWLWLCWFKPCS